MDSKNHLYCFPTKDFHVYCTWNSHDERFEAWVIFKSVVGYGDNVNDAVNNLLEKLDGKEASRSRRKRKKTDSP